MTRRAVVLLLLLAACSGYRRPGDSDYVRSGIDDRNIATRVRIVLGEDPQTAPYDSIRVSCEEGVVTLTGAVDRRAVRRRAVDLAEGCEGVVHVENRIELR